MTAFIGQTENDFSIPLWSLCSACNLLLCSTLIAIWIAFIDSRHRASLYAFVKWNFRYWCSIYWLSHFALLCVWGFFLLVAMKGTHRFFPYVYVEISMGESAYKMYTSINKIAHTIEHITNKPITTIDLVSTQTKANNMHTYAKTKCVDGAKKSKKDGKRSNEISLVAACVRSKNAFIYRSWIFNRLRSIWATTTTTNVWSRL